MAETSLRQYGPMLVSAAIEIVLRHAQANRINMFFSQGADEARLGSAYSFAMDAPLAGTDNLQIGKKDLDEQHTFWIASGPQLQTMNTGSPKAMTASFWISPPNVRIRLRNSLESSGIRAGLSGHRRRTQRTLAGIQESPCPRTAAGRTGLAGLDRNTQSVVPCLRQVQNSQNHHQAGAPPHRI